MDTAGSKRKFTVEDFEKIHAHRSRPKLSRPSVIELVLTLVVSFVLTPFAFVTGTIIPMMGQMTVLFALSLTLLYLFFRRSFLVAAVALGSTMLFWVVLLSMIQSIKNELDVTLFILTALGIPVCAIYCMFIGTRIWIIRGGVD
jgi:hypothetical protein